MGRAAAGIAELLHRDAPAERSTTADIRGTVTRPSRMFSALSAFHPPDASTVALANVTPVLPSADGATMRNADTLPNPSSLNERGASCERSLFTTTTERGLPAVPRTYAVRFSPGVSTSTGRHWSQPFFATAKASIA